MLLIKNESTNAYFNLALEEYLLDNFNEDCFCLWRNDKAIIVGKNQNTLSEINLSFVKENDIKVVRRLTGGGAVFHDLGNINFTFIENKKEKDNFNDYLYFTKDVIGFLATLGIKAELSGRNDICVDGKKISGNAQCIRNNKVMHHGTLLFNADLSYLVNALKVKPDKIISKGIKSVSSRVSNIYDYLSKKMDVLTFKKKLEEYILLKNEDAKPYELTKEDIDNVNKLVKDKYFTWEWNFGNSPDYNFNYSKKFDFGLIELHLQINNGIIEKARIAGDFFGKRDIGDVEAVLINQKHNDASLKEALSRINLDDYIMGISLDEFVNLLMGID